MTDRIYSRSIGIVLNAINDIVELQKAKLTFSDTKNGKINFMVTMYANEREFCFTVTDLGNKRSRVCLEVSGEQSGGDDVVLRELSLLDSMIATCEEIEAAKKAL